MRLEMHAHDCEVSPCAVIKAKELVDGYKEAGYDGIVITNHFDKGIMHLWGETTEEHYQTYLRGYELAKEEGERVGLRVILGMEIRLECGPEDYLVYGVTKDFIRQHMDICECSLQELYGDL
ncbi:MAG: PHP domain-containing protein [Lachnospiraceae bacterium]